MPQHHTPTSSVGEPVTDERAAALEGAASLEYAMEAHRVRVHRGLHARIAAAGGFLPFEQFMDYVLYEPGLGFYSGGAQKLGKDGDFITAPEVSALFGSCVAVQCAEVLAQAADPVVLEIGAGTGRLAVDVLTRLHSLEALPAEYWILESSADLRERQRRLLADCPPHLSERVQWIDAPPERGFEGVILANEILDALPVARFRWQESAVEELGVAVCEGELVEAARPARAALAAAVEQLHASAGSAWEAGYESEFCPRLPAWTRAVTAALDRGAVLWFDYGLPRAQYYFAQRREGTMMCHYRHRAHDDFLLHPGLQDITSWVDFTQVAEAAHAANYELAGFTTQAHFLAATGIDREMRRLSADEPQAFARLANQARRLMLPGEMGERFKVMAWTRNVRAELIGLSLVDLRHSL